jgi:hypothetical protein
MGLHQPDFRVDPVRFDSAEMGPDEYPEACPCHSPVAAPSGQ